MRNGNSSVNPLRNPRGVVVKAALLVKNRDIDLCVGGLVPFTTIDFPGHLAAVIFLRGCSWKCLYCQNPHLQQNTKVPDDAIPWKLVEDFLSQRQGKLDGIVFSGGDPLLTPQLKAVVERVHSFGFFVALHTGGILPEHFAEVLPSLDWVGFDVKTIFEDYSTVTQIPDSGLAAEQSLDLLVKSGIPFEVRTSAHPSFLPSEKLLQLANSLVKKEVNAFALQRIRDMQGEYVPEFYDIPFIQKLQSLFKEFTVR
ncbi:MAG: anaerobic ribonucleoside-triphosphate reductase activating protein [Holosporales bacterium]|jgi:anaerobic ribonucleoside-triphosphate reductase activating protein|nr:anaerobic ribonucleoside-triphosphate reductase activating protein [Holosporales bacterium]